MYDAEGSKRVGGANLNQFENKCCSSQREIIEDEVDWGARIKRSRF